MPVGKGKPEDAEMRGVPGRSSRRAWPWILSAQRRPPLAHSAAVAACIGLLGAGAAGCSTTQDKAAAHQLESARILKARAERKKQRQKNKGKDGKSESHDNGGNKQ